MDETYRYQQQQQQQQVVIHERDARIASARSNKQHQ
jgi:hypothetical protein